MVSIQQRMMSQRRPLFSFRAGHFRVRYTRALSQLFALCCCALQCTQQRTKYTSSFPIACAKCSSVVVLCPVCFRLSVCVCVCAWWSMCVRACECESMHAERFLETKCILFTNVHFGRCHYEAYACVWYHPHTHTYIHCTSYRPQIPTHAGIRKMSHFLPFIQYDKDPRNEI